MTESKTMREYFSHPDHHYVANRVIDPMLTYRAERIALAQEVFDLTLAEATKSVDSIIKSNYVDPTVVFYKRDKKTKDKYVRRSPLSTYIKDVYNDDDVLIPSFSSFDKQDLSLDSIWTTKKKADRNYHKDLKKLAKQKGDYETMSREDGNQATKKVAVNALSGHYALTMSPLHTFSLHYALTSGTRVTTSLGNHKSERILGGNRNWLNELDALEDIIMFSKHYNYDTMYATVKEYNLVIPNPKLVQDFVFEKMLGWSNTKIGLTMLQEYINNLEPMRQAYIFYAMDLHNTFKLNPKFAKTYIQTFTARVRSDSKDISKFNDLEYNVKNFIYTVNADIMMGRELDFSIYKSTRLGDVLVGSYDILMLGLEKYKLFFKTLFKDVPSLTRRLSQTKHMIKQAGVLSDTDSMCPAAYSLIKGEIDRSMLEANALRSLAPIVMVLSENVTNALTTYAAICNASPEKYKHIAMKAEYIWTVFTPSPTSKHYVNVEHIQEFFTTMAGEVSTSGVHLIGGKMRPFLKDLYESFKKEILTEIEMTGILNYRALTKMAGMMEARVITTAKEKPELVLPLEMVKEPETYSRYKSTKGTHEEKVKQTLAFHHTMYKKHFAKLFNSPPPELPYLAYKVYFKKGDGNRFSHNARVVYDTPNKLFKAEGKGIPSSLRIPVDVVDYRGLPKEWYPMLDTAEIVKKALAPMYNFLATMGLSKPKNKLFLQIHPS